MKCKRTRLLSVLMYLVITLSLLINSFVNTLSVHAEELDLPKVAIISDIHGGRADWEFKLTKTLRILARPENKLDAVFIVGDLTNSGTKEEFANLKRVLDAELVGIPYYLMLGNHDYLSYTPTETVKNYLAEFPGQLNQYIEIKGYPFIMISCDDYYGYQETAKNFLTASLADAAAKYTGKPIFVMNHYPVSGTSYGSYAVYPGDTGWGVDQLTNILDDYPQVIDFAGHTHYTLIDERSIYQGAFTSVNTGDVCYIETEKGLVDGTRPAGSADGLQGMYVSAKENGDIQIDRYDFFNDFPIKAANPWIVEAPHDGSKLSKYSFAKRDTIAPSFKEGDGITVSNITTSECTISFPQASDNDLVQQYQIEVIKGTTSCQLLRKSSLMFMNVNVPETISWNISGLINDVDYTVKVSAVDSFGNKSEPISASFKTEKYIPDPVTVIPVADMFDVAFMPDGKTKDLSDRNMNIVPTVTAPDLYYNEAIKKYSSKYNGDGRKVFKISYAGNQDFKNNLINGFTLEAYAKFTTTNVGDIIGGTEKGGIGIERESGANGRTQLWMRVNDAYKAVGSFVTNQTDFYHFVFTYDGKVLKSYVNGTPCGEVIISTSADLPVQLPVNEAAQWFGIGGDAYTSANAQNPMTGEIAISRLYSEAISLDQAILLYKQIQDRIALTKADDLNKFITELLPKFKADLSAEDALVIDTLISEGWDLMNKMDTTDAKISEYITKVEQKIKQFQVAGATLAGNNSVNAGDEFMVSYGLNSVSKSVYGGVYAQDITMKYNPNAFDFVGAQPLGEKTVILETYNSAPGIYRFIVASVGEAITQDGQVFGIKFKAKDNTAGSETIELLNVELTNGEGTVIKAATSNLSIEVKRVGVDKTMLNQMIAASQATLDSTVEGIEIGQYPSGAKKRLQAAIVNAQAVANNESAAQTDVNTAIAELSSAQNKFNSLKITESTGDISNNKTIDLGDLGIVAGCYGEKEGSSNWEAANVADINGDGEIGIYDLAFIAKKIIRK